MATCFDHWEKDPFFSAAEEVQESSDRLESVYRQWMQETREEGSDGELHHELHTALGTAKWQLEELERAVKLNDEAHSAGENTRARHDQFVAAIECRIVEVENSLKESNLAEGKAALSWVCLDEGERDELALFLSGPVEKHEKVVTIPSVGDLEVGKNAARVKQEVAADSLKNSSGSTEPTSWAMRRDKVPGHRRVASASADIGAWMISMTSEGEETSGSSDDPPAAPLPKILSFSGLMGALESKPRMKWHKNTVRKWRPGDQHDVEESASLKNSQLTQASDGCYERNKSCLSTCGEEIYDKKLYGWVGTVRRQLQRSQYQIQYGHPVQLIVVAILTFTLILFFAFSRIW